MFDGTGFSPHGGGDDEPDEPDEPVILADDTPPRSWFWPMFWIGLALVLILQELNR